MALETGFDLRRTIRREEEEGARDWIRPAKNDSSCGRRERLRLDSICEEDAAPSEQVPTGRLRKQRSEGGDVGAAAPGLSAADHAAACDQQHGAGVSCDSWMSERARQVQGLVVQLQHTVGRTPLKEKATK